jgi:5,10-methenyltetrahydromethanopterin hydrogenase
MSNRFQELAVQAGFYSNTDVEKFNIFAELIVEECANLLEQGCDNKKLQGTMDSMLFKLLKGVGGHQAQFLRDHFEIK